MRNNVRAKLRDGRPRFAICIVYAYLNFYRTLDVIRKYSKVLITEMPEYLRCDRHDIKILRLILKY